MQMRIITKAILGFGFTIASGAVAGGQFAYRERQQNLNLPQNNIDIGSKTEKKAVIIGTKYSNDKLDDLV